MQPTAPAVNPFDEFIALYRNDPVRFVREVFGADPDPWQADLMNAVARGERRISVVSGHGVGKTTVLAWLIVWFILTRFPQKTVCTAPTSGQLFDALASEVKAWITKLPPMLQTLLEVKSERIELKAAPNESFIAFNTSRPEKPEAMAGVHSENVLLIGDEASGIPEAVFEAAIGSMSGKHAVTILAGNGVRSSGLFFKTHNDAAFHDTWFRREVSCLDVPRCDRDFIKQVLDTYGEKSNAYRVRVLGKFPLADDDTVIPFELVEAAYKRDVQPSTVAVNVWGVDCARFGQDSSALAKRKGNVLREPVREWHGLDTMELVGRIKTEWDTTAISERPTDINVDVIGLGAGVVDRLRELDLPCRGINVSESPALGDKYANLRTELWFKGKEWFLARDCNLCNDEKTGKELIKPRYTIKSNGKLQVESKDDMKKRKEASPNRADAFLLTLATDAIIASSGSGYASSWKEKQTRVIKGIV